MDMSAIERRLIAAIQDGLPLEARPYEAIGRAIGLSEDEAIARIRILCEQGVIGRFGLVLSHRGLGYRANAMVVWDIPDERVGAVGEALAALPYVTLCYRRPRCLPDWPYNLFCMIHGRDRSTVQSLVEDAAREAGTEAYPRALLFSTRQFKQRGARYARPGPAGET